MKRSSLVTIYKLIIGRFVPVSPGRIVLDNWRKIVYGQITKHRPTSRAGPGGKL